MLAAGLGALWCKHDQLAVKVNLCPSEPADLCAPLAGQKQKANDVGKAPLAKVVPELAQFVGGEHAFAAAILSCLASADDRIAFYKALLDCPCVEGRERSPSTV